MPAEEDSFAGVRLEHDSLGERPVDASVYYGVHTARALENFSATGIPISSHTELIKGLAAVKQAAAEANRQVGLLAASKAEAIVAACREIRAGALHDQFVVDVLQGGAGTSTNMNANEVIANRGLELLGCRRGEYQYLHPLEDVNLSQSTNDAYPTAAKIGIRQAALGLVAAMESLRGAFGEKAVEFHDITKIGRTQLQDAVPITLGSEFAAYATMVGEDVQRLAEARRLIREINLGGTAVGTGINATPQYGELVVDYLRRIVDEDLVASEDLVEATQDAGAFVQLSGVLKRIAVKLSKVCNDLRLLSSGPRSGLCELRLPPVQAGSSIMPGKINPVIPEMVNQIAFRVVGNDVTVTMAAEGGQLQLNAFEPVMVHSLFESISILRCACETLAARCVAGIRADRQRISEHVTRSVGVVTALSPRLGYARSSALASEALISGQSVNSLVLARGLMARIELEQLLDEWSHPPESAAAGVQASRSGMAERG